MPRPFALAAPIALLLTLLCQPLWADDFSVLHEHRDGQLQRLLERELHDRGLLRAAHRGRLAVALVDVTAVERPRVAAVNGDKMMYAASLPKIGILLAAMHEVQEGRFRLNAPLMRSLTEMIRLSSNVEATRMMNLVGKRRVNDILASPRYRFYDREMNGGLWVGKEYGKRPAFQRDPMHNISHGATAMQVARFYYLLEAGRLLENPRLNAAMKLALSRPAIQHKFVKGLRGRNVEIFRKSGTWRQYHSDSAIVKTPRGSYILVALAEHPRGGDWLTKLAGDVHDALYPRQLAKN